MTVIDLNFDWLFAHLGGGFASRRLAIVKKELQLQRSLGEILQIASICLFDKTPLLQAFSRDSLRMEDSTIHNQLPLFDY